MKPPAVDLCTQQPEDAGSMPPSPRTWSVPDSAIKHEEATMSVHIRTSRKDMTMEYILLFLVGIAIGGPLLWWASKQP